MSRELKRILYAALLVFGVSLVAIGQIYYSEIGIVLVTLCSAPLAFWGIWTYELATKKGKN